MATSKGNDTGAKCASVVTSLATGTLIGFVAMTPGLQYGAWLFVFLPVLCGMAAGFAGNWKRRLNKNAGWIIAGWSLLISSIILLLFAWEGIICLLMAGPLLYLGHVGGYFVAVALLDRAFPRAMQVSFLPVVAMATLYQARQITPTEVRMQTTDVEIDATAEEIWPLLFNLDKIEPTGNLMFKLGVAHPIATRSNGQRVGSRRECVLTTGTMPEVITESIPGRRLEFRVIETPPSMVELNPFGPTNPPHLHDNYKVHRGSFTLTELPNGRTRVVGKSEYSYRVQPAVYWNLWTDLLVREIHISVLHEIKRRVEK